MTARPAPRDGSSEATTVPTRSTPGMSGEMRATRLPGRVTMPVLVVDGRPLDPDGDLAGGRGRRGPVVRTPASMVSPVRVTTKAEKVSGSEPAPARPAPVGMGREGHRGYRTDSMSGQPASGDGEEVTGDPVEADFGWWPSPWSASVVAAGKVSRSGLQADGDWLYWIREPARRRRPPGGGAGPAGTSLRSTSSPAAVSVRSRVHEYGGGAATVVGGVLFYVDQADQRWYRWPDRRGRPPIALHPRVAGRRVRPSATPTAG